MTTGVDQMVALHTSSQDDVLLCLQRGELCPNQDRVGELVGAIVDHFTRSVTEIFFFLCLLSRTHLYLCCQPVMHIIFRVEVLNTSLQIIAMQVFAPKDD